MPLDPSQLSLDQQVRWHLLDTCLQSLDDGFAFASPAHALYFAEDAAAFVLAEPRTLAQEKWHFTAEERFALLRGEAGEVPAQSIADIPANEQDQPIADTNVHQCTLTNDCGGDHPTAEASTALAEDTPPQSTGSLSEGELVALQACRRVKGATFRAADVQPLMAGFKRSVATYLSTLTSKGKLRRVEPGLYEIAGPTACKDNPFAAKSAPVVALVARPQPAAPKPAAQPGPDPLAHIIKWLAGEDIEAKTEGNGYRVNGRIRHTPETLVEMANRLRAKHGLPLYSIDAAVAP